MLDKIVADKKEELEQRKKAVPASELEALIAQRAKPLDFAATLKRGGVSLIAEVKRASPSRGVLCPDFKPVELARTYADNGAAAISVLTENKYFHGHLEHLAEVREAVEIPLLRKDFIFDPYQVYESRAGGADALLLIVSILEQAQLEELLLLSHKLDLSCLVEVHHENEVEKALRSHAQIIGINNRDLKTFHVDTGTTQRLRALIPKDRVVVSESGISRRRDMENLESWGVNAALVGEALLTAGDIAAKVRELVK
ncbi:MAG: indole-3-glycerol phosphate synthase TrpC [Dehalococcoidia bacterium]|nr:MAG: indole-3-glycerol phosphate synthase TrpC [Dehalococcoidia bacterium]